MPKKFLQNFSRRTNPGSMHSSNLSNSGYTKMSSNIVYHILKVTVYNFSDTKYNRKIYVRHKYTINCKNTTYFKRKYKLYFSRRIKCNIIRGAEAELSSVRLFGYQIQKNFFYLIGTFRYLKEQHFLQNNVSMQNAKYLATLGKSKTSLLSLWKHVFLSLKKKKNL